MSNFALLTLSDHIAADRHISADEALELRRAIFPDGVVSRSEADVMISLEGRVANRDDTFAQAFIDAIVDHVLQSGPYTGHVDETTAAWLMQAFGDEGARETEVEVLLEVLERAESAPEALGAFARSRVASLLAGKPICAAETEFVRRALYVAAGPGAIAVTEDEARWLFALDAESDGRANDPAWTDLFVKAVLNHLMGRRAPKLLEGKSMLARQQWLASRPEGVGAFMRAMFAFGPEWLQKARYREVDAFEAHYEQANADRAEDEKLTLEEIAWAVGVTREDRKRTANEDALLAEIRKIENGEA
ncbi:MAG: hypothetical protein AB7O98_18355 [Hyphomonadaceae bacterium]